MFRPFLLLLALISGPAGAATVEIELFNFRFEPNDVTINVGDTVRWTNRSGFHDVRADDGSFGRTAASAEWIFERTFNAPGDVRVHCSIHSNPGRDVNQNMNGIVRVRQASAGFAINQGIFGAWFEPATSGQGFLIDIEPASRFIFVAWFTYERAAGAKVGVPEHRWLSAQGNYTGNTATLPIFQTAGGRFDTAATTTTTQVGTMQISFSSCTAGSIQYTLTGENLSGTIPIERVIAGTSTLCETLAAP